MVVSAKISEAQKSMLCGRKNMLLDALRNNAALFEQYSGVPLLKAGDIYNGIWLEHNQDCYFIARYMPEIAWASQDVFIQHQREDGLLPFAFMLHPQEEHERVCFSHIQSVWPFARSAMEIAKITNRPESDFIRIYRAAEKYDHYLSTSRNRAKTGLVEMYCEWDTGHDNDPRVMDGGIPHTCPGFDAGNMPDLPVMPILSVDLSAMLYGNRIAMAELADILGMSAEKKKWEDAAQQLKELIYQYLYDPEDEFFYDRSPQGFRKYRTEHITRLFLNKVVEQEQFDRIWKRYFSTPGKEFLPNFPFPSVSVNDERFVGGMLKNSWGGNTQAPTTLRAFLWMDHYNRSAELDAVLSCWLKAFAEYPQSDFPQEIDPFSGAPVGAGKNFTPTLLVHLMAMQRLKWFEKEDCQPAETIL